MSTLSSKSAQEISDLLDEYRIKHGPIVDTTRPLYEKKLREAMAKEKKAKPSPDRTYYREEEEEVTYVYRNPMRSEAVGERGPYMRTRPEFSEREYGQEKFYSSYSKSKPEHKARDFVDEPYMYDSPSSYRNISYLKSTPVRSAEDAPKVAKSSRLVPLWVQFLLFLAVAAFLYFVFSNMEMTDSSPFKGIQ